jgi:hypothetical protein
MADNTSLASLGPCPVCGRQVGRPIAACPSCRTAHHVDCWEYNGGCAIYACAGRPAEEPPLHLRWQPERFLARAGLMVLVLAAAAMFVISGRSRPVHVTRLALVPEEIPAAVFETSRRAPCIVEVARADRPFTPVLTRKSRRGKSHRVVLPGLERGASYVVRAWAYGPFVKPGPVATRLFALPPVRPLAIEPPAGPKGPPVAYGRLPVAAIELAGPARPLPPASGLRDPFRPVLRLNSPPVDLTGEEAFRPSRPLRVRVEPASPGPGRPLFGPFTLKVGTGECTVAWRTRKPVELCRVILSRDASLRGIERVFDAQTRKGTHHRVVLSGLTPDSSYQVLVLGFSRDSDPQQSPVVAFRTMSR